MNLVGVIGRHIDSGSGLKDVWVQSGAIGPLKADKILNGKSYKSGMRYHKLPLLMFYEQHNNDLFIDLTSVSYNDNDLLPLITRCKSEDMRVMVNELICSRKKDNNNFTFWWSYLELVEIQYTRSLRGANWELYLHSFKRMMPYFLR